MARLSASEVARTSLSAFWIYEQSADLLKPQIRGPTPLALGFAPVTRHRVIGPWQAPVGGALRGPGEIGRARKMRQRPCAVAVDIADEAKFAIRLQDARHGGDGCVLHEAPLPVSPLRPWIGMDQIDSRQRAGWRPGQQLRGV